MTTAVIQAAGAVLWRPGAGAPEIALVHRPQYDDWSLPKGKLAPDEPAVLGAVREVLEETGHRGVVGRRVGLQRYDKLLPTGPTPKEVRFWSMRDSGGEFIPTEEVDELRWLPPAHARSTVTLDRDRDVIQAFIDQPHDTWPAVVVRHGSAGRRDRWRGDDARRPLDAAGIAQAAAVAAVLHCYGVTRIVSAHVDRCVQTVQPFADAAGVAIKREPLLSEPGYAADPAAALDLCLSLLKEEQPVALCTQRRVVSPLTADLLRACGRDGPGITLAKGALAVLHVSAGTVIDVEQHPPPDEDEPEGSPHG